MSRHGVDFCAPQQGIKRTDLHNNWCKLHPTVGHSAHRPDQDFPKSPMDRARTRPSPRIQALLRQGAELALSAPSAWLDELDQASVPPDDLRTLAEDPVLMAATRRINRGSLIHWAAANVEKPGAPVPPYVSDDIRHNARELLRLGATDVIFSSSRATHHAAWRLWMNIAFELTQDPQELRELLELSSRSIAEFIDGTMNEVAAFLRTEREAQNKGTHPDRLRMISRILAGETVSAKQAQQRLAYNLDHSHLAAIIWREQSGADAQPLDAAIQLIHEQLGFPAMVSVAANEASRWVWWHYPPAWDVARLRWAFQALPSVRVTLAPGEPGLAGFRQAHVDALTTQRCLGRFQHPNQVTVYEQVQLVNLLSQDADALPRFISQTLGALAEADVSLQNTLWTYIQTGCNASEAASRLHLHRNTLLRRLARAQELLPRPLPEHLLKVGAALELLQWSRPPELKP